MDFARKPCSLYTVGIFAHYGLASYRSGRESYQDYTNLVKNKGVENDEVVTSELP